jgi:hypothetical protein
MSFLQCIIKINSFREFHTIINSNEFHINLVFQVLLKFIKQEKNSWIHFRWICLIKINCRHLPYTFGEHIKLYKYVLYQYNSLYCKNHIYLINFTSSGVWTTSPKSSVIWIEFDFTEIVYFYLQIFSLSIIVNKLWFMILVITSHI